MNVLSDWELISMCIDLIVILMELYDAIVH